MNILLRYVVLPLVVFWLGCVFFLRVTLRFPIYVAAGVGILVIIAVINGRRIQKGDDDVVGA